MKSTSIAASLPQKQSSALGILSRVARKGVLARLRQIRHGRIALHENGNVHVFGKSTERCPLAVEVRVIDDAFFSDIAFGGSLGAGDSYTAGRWTCDDLTGLIRIFCVNRDVLSIPDSPGSPNPFSVSPTG
jgi:cyclopropane-fatty-acyl-phospholipid synthase